MPHLDVVLAAVLKLEAQKVGAHAEVHGRRCAATDFRTTIPKFLFASWGAHFLPVGNSVILGLGLLCVQVLTNERQNSLLNLSSASVSVITRSIDFNLSPTTRSEITHRINQKRPIFKLAVDYRVGGNKGYRFLTCRRSSGRR